MRILITTEFYLPFECGVTTAIVNLKKGLEELGHEVKVLTISKEAESREFDGVYYIASKGRQLYQDSYVSINTGDKLVDEAIKWRPAIINAHSEFFSLLFAKKIARKLNIPIVQTCHTDFESYGVHFMKNKRLWRFLVKTFVPLLIRKSSQITCPSGKLKTMLEGYGVKKRIEIVPSALELSTFKQELAKAERDALLSSFGFKPDDIVLLSACRLSKEKQVDQSIRRFKLLKESFKNIRLLIVGGGDEEETLRELTKEDSTIHLTGRVAGKDIWKYYKCADIFISSSESETLGLTNIEALASSLPIICKRDEALFGYLEEGMNGFTFQTDEDFIACCADLLSDRNLLLSMKENAEKSTRLFSIAIYAKKMLDIYDRALLEGQTKRLKYTPIE